MRAGTLIRVRRMVAVRAVASPGPVRVAAARVRLNAMVARTSQAALAEKRPEGRWARAESLRPVWTCSMMACPRWVLSAVTVSRSVVGEEGVEAPDVEQGGLPIGAGGVEVGDATHHQPAGDLLAGLARAERGEVDFGDFTA